MFLYGRCFHLETLHVKLLAAEKRVGSAEWANSGYPTIKVQKTALEITGQPNCSTGGFITGGAQSGCPVDQNITLKG